MTDTFEINILKKSYLPPAELQSTPKGTYTLIFEKHCFKGSSLFIQHGFVVLSIISLSSDFALIDSLCSSPMGQEAQQMTRQAGDKPPDQSHLFRLKEDGKHR